MFFHLLRNNAPNTALEPTAVGHHRGESCGALFARYALEKNEYNG